MTKDRLKSYQEKRDFHKTKEPSGHKTIKSAKKIFVIQKHDAQQLHYDFRLSVEGVLASWAVPKGLSTVPNEKHLAIRTEDHPLDYADFEGVIPEGQYGGGTVMVWDIGEYEPIIESEEHKKTTQEALNNGALKFTLKGKKLKGGYVLVRTGIRQGKEQWLIFKLDDEYADARRNPIKTEPNSILSGRSLEEIAKEEGEGND